MGPSDSLASFADNEQYITGLRFRVAELGEIIKSMYQISDDVKEKWTDTNQAYFVVYRFNFFLSSF